MVLGALAALLELESDIKVVARARDGKLALDAVVKQQPEVLITDIEMPQMTGLEVASEIKRLGLKTRIIILTTFARPGYLRRALEAGASAYLLKDMPSDQLADSVRRVHRGLRVIDPELASEAWTEQDPFTDRERQVLRMASEGMTTAAIATEVGLSDGTVRNYLSEAISKIGASNRVEAARIARKKDGSENDRNPRFTVIRLASIPKIDPVLSFDTSSELGHIHTHCAGSHFGYLR
jgi:two-component system response regulator DesR